MAEIFPLRPSEHDTVQKLLPWHVNGTLAADEAARVEAHLQQCAECREDLDAEHGLARDVALLPLHVDEGWQAMALRIGDAPASANEGVSGLLRRRIPAGWAVGGAIAASIALTLAAVSLRQPSVADQTFHTLGSPASSKAGQLVVLFRPDTSERQMRALLAAQGARVVDGPTAAGAYVLRVDGRSPSDAIGALRLSDQVVLAEPLTSDGRP